MANSKQQPEPEAHEQPEIRDSAEIFEELTRQIAGLSLVPIGSDGRPMAQLTVGVSDKLPTVQYGNVIVGPVMTTRWVDDLGDGIEGRQHRIDRQREMLKDAEFVCGVERRLLQWAIDPAMRVASPVQPDQAFAAPPAGYDAGQVADAREVPAAAPVLDAPAVTPEQAVEQPLATPAVQPVVVDPAAGPQLG